MDVGGDVGFTISPAAETVIRDGGGELWIWASDDGRPCASSSPPRIYGTSFTTYTPDGLVIRVDSRIVPPWRWRLTAVEGEPAVTAAWDGLDPRVFDREPLAERPDPRRYVLAGAVVVGSALAVLWAMHFVRVTSEWLTVGHLLLTTVLATIAGIAWLNRKQGELRADRTLKAELERSALPLRPPRQDPGRGDQLG